MNGMLEFVRARLGMLRLLYGMEQDSIQNAIYSAMIGEYEELEEWLVERGAAGK